MISINTAVYFSSLKQADPTEENEEVGEVCIANISPLERQKRMRFGIQVFISTFGVLAVLIALHVNPLWRLPLLFLFWASAIGYFQARDKT